MKKTIIVLLSLMSVLLIVGCAANKVAKETPKTEAQEVTPLDQDLNQINPELIYDTANIDSDLNDATNDLESIS